MKANPGEVVRNSLNSYEWLRARKQRRNVEKKKFFNRVIIYAYEAVGVQSLKISYKSTRMTFIFAILGPNHRVKLVGECSAFLASGSDPTDERCVKHGPQTTPRRGRALTERVIASRALTFHRVKHRECAHAFFSCNAYLETLRYVPESARPDRYEICYAVSQPLTLI